MFVTDRLIYLQMRKTACTHIARVLGATVGGQNVGYKHSPIPNDFSIGERQIISSIRNPWDYYVSSWAYGIKNKEGGLRKRLTTRHYGYYLRQPSRWRRAPRGLFNMLTKPADRWESFYADAEDTIAFRTWLHLLLNPRRKFDNGEPYGFSSIAKFAGLMSFRYARLVWRDRAPLFDGSVRSLSALQATDAQQNQLHDTIQLESLATDLITTLIQAGHLLSPEQIAAIEQANRTNTSRRQMTDFYYDAETIALVAEKERFIIEKYGYQPPEL